MKSFGVTLYFPFLIISLKYPITLNPLYQDLSLPPSPIIFFLSTLTLTVSFVLSESIKMFSFTLSFLIYIVTYIYIENRLT